MERWSPPLASRSEQRGRRHWRTVGAEVVASAGEPLGASYPRDPTGVEVVHTCRHKARVPLEGGCNNFVFVRYFLVLLIEQY